MRDGRRRGAGAVVVGLVVLALAVGGGTVRAAPLTFFGQDLNLAGAIDDSPPRLTSFPNSQAAQTAFLDLLTVVSVADFESFTGGSPPPDAPGFTGDEPPLNVVFPGIGTATLQGSGGVISLPGTGSDFGRYPISGDFSSTR